MPSGRCQRAHGWFVLVAGWPGSGKSTLAAALAAELGLPLLAKDEIKEALMEVLGQPETVAASQRLGKAAPARDAARRPDVPRGGAGQHLVRLCTPAGAHASRPAHRGALHRSAGSGQGRYRARTGHRHAGHLDDARTNQELWGEPARPLGLGPVVMVDTSSPVDIAELATTMAQALAAT